MPPGVHSGQGTLDTNEFDPSGPFAPESPEFIRTQDTSYEFSGFQISKDRSAEVVLWQSTHAEPDFFACSPSLVTADTIDIHCPSTPVGTIDITGHFIDKHFRAITVTGMPSSLQPVEATATAAKNGHISWRWRGKFIVREFNGE